MISLPPTTCSRGRRAFLMTEAVIAVSILGLLLTMMARLQIASGRYHQRLMTGQRCTAAAQAQLDSLETRGGVIEPDEVERLWPGLTCEVRLQGGAGDWDGLVLATVEVTGLAGEREVTVTQSRYMRPRGEVRP